MCLSPGKKGLAHGKILFLRRKIRTPQGADTVPSKMQNRVKVKLGQGRQTNTFGNSMTISSNVTFRFSPMFFLPKKKAFHVKGEKLHSLLSLKSFFIPTLRAQNPVNFMSLF